MIKLRMNIFGHINKFCTSAIHPVNIIEKNRITFYIARHGQTLLNRLDRVQGWADSPLTALGEQTARELGQVLSPVIFRAAYISDTDRIRLVFDEEVFKMMNRIKKEKITVTTCRQRSACSKVPWSKDQDTGLSSRRYWVQGLRSLSFNCSNLIKSFFSLRLLKK